MFKNFKEEYIKGEPINATHYMAEEIPEEIAKRMSEFFLRSIKS